MSVICRLKVFVLCNLHLSLQTVAPRQAARRSPRSRSAKGSGSSRLDCFLCTHRLREYCKVYREKKCCTACFAAIRARRRQLAGQNGMLEADAETFRTDPGMWRNNVLPFKHKETRSAARAETKAMVNKYREEAKVDENLRFRDTLWLNKDSYIKPMRKRGGH